MPAPRSRWLKPVLILSTVLNVWTFLTAGLLYVVLSVGTGLLFMDSPTATPGGNIQMAFGALLPLFLLFVLFPVAIIIIQWVLFAKKKDKASMIVAIVGLVPEIGIRLWGLVS